ncbi:hypothetical protein J0895_01015 [Phormidium pseudopriestleyi FRX01]|uniref:Transposase n=1 Tax=Phormidium pseudopriestleyi FRX01 TaxID=1759528 RepID=A0ABS3FKS7_9CYAN|nr:hypothetical protein [Phormidium pseudopriestleyi]MBO0347710.1 hypothetical protein [Phormidium pseudopriestleyi FRX01]
MQFCAWTYCTDKGRLVPNGIFAHFSPVVMWMGFDRRSPRHSLKFDSILATL